MPELRPWSELPHAGAVDAATAEQPDTGGWRTGLKPEVELSSCVNCLLCWIYCPDSAVVLDGDDVRRLRPRPLQGLRDLRRDLPGRTRSGWCPRSRP